MLEVPARPQFDEDVPADEDGKFFQAELNANTHHGTHWNNLKWIEITLTRQNILHTDYK